MAQLKGEVAIVGGGLSGMAMAVALDSVGVSTLLIDRSAAALDPTAIDDARTTAISYTSRRMLEALDLWPAEAAAPILDIHVTDGPSRLFLHFDHRAAGDQPRRHVQKEVIPLPNDRTARSRSPSHVMCVIVRQR